MGDSQEAAIDSALERFGEPTQIAERFRRAWNTTTPRDKVPWRAGLLAGLWEFDIVMSLVLGAPALASQNNPLFHPLLAVFVPIFLFALPVAAAMRGGFRPSSRSGDWMVYTLGVFTVALPFLCIVAEACGSGAWHTGFFSRSLLWCNAFGWLSAMATYRAASRFRDKRTTVKGAA